MAKVPYQPVPEEEPRNASISIATPPEAFGMGIASATKEAGQEVKAAGNELFARAADMQRLKIEADVNQQASDYLLATGKLDNEFRQLSGDQPQEKLEAHKELLRSTRETFRAQITSPYGQKMFDRETMRRMGYDVVNAGNYAATELKKYNSQSYETNQVALAERASRDPNNMAALDDAIRISTDNEKKLSYNEGDKTALTSEPSDFTKARVGRRVGKLIADVAVAKALRDPDGGMKLLEDNREKLPGLDSGMPPDVYQKALEAVTTRKIQYNAALDARRLSGGTILPSDHPVTKGSAAISKIGEQFGEGTTFTPENIYKLVQQESRGQNLPPNQYGYAGYFQMKPKEFGLTPADFRNMSFEQQLELYANSYLKGKGYTGSQDLGVMNAAPDFKDSPDTTIAYPSGSKEAAANPAWVRASAAGGAVTVGGIKAWMEAGAGGIQRTPEVSLPDIMEKASARGKELFKDDPISQERYTEQVLSNAQRNTNLMRSQLNQTKQAQRNSVDEVLFRVGPGDRGPTSWEDAERLRPGFQDLVTKAAELNPSIVKHINDTFTYNSKQDVDPTPERDAKYSEYLGLSYGLNPGDKEKFLNTSLSTLDLTQKDYRDLYKRQLNAQKQLQDTSKLRSAMYTVGPLLNEAKIFNSHTDTAKARAFNIFQGGFLQKLEEFEAREKRFPNEQEQIAIASPLLRKIGGSWTSWTRDRLSFMPPPDKIPDIITTFKERYGGREPNSMEIGQIWQRIKGAQD